MRPDFIPVGAVVNAHGIRGEVKVNPAGFDPEFIASFKTLYIGGQPVKVISARVHKSTVLLALPGVATMDDALALKGKTVSIRRTDAKLPKGQYFDAELNWISRRQNLKETYDPRTRPWYQGAIDSGRQITTEPYVFFSCRDVGTTLARITRDRTVMGADLTAESAGWEIIAQDEVTGLALAFLVARAFSSGTTARRACASACRRRSPASPETSPSRA